MKILYDGQIYRLQKAGGINRYFAAIISGLPAHYSPTLFGVEQGGLNFPEHRNLRLNRLIPFVPGGLSRVYLTKVAGKFGLPGWDLAHPTYYELSNGFRYSDYKCPIVVTVHDMLHAMHGELMIDGGEIAAWQKEAVFAASAIICVSEHTMNDLLNVYSVLQDRTVVIYPGGGLCDIAISDRNWQPSNYFLFVGSRSGYKNFEGVLAAFRNVCSISPLVRLCVVGNKLTERERWAIFDLGLRDKIDVVVNPPDRQLSDLYRHSVALLYPSRFEGFGIPPLEAMACGTAVVCANTTSLPEVVGDAGVLLHPLAIDDWTEAMLLFTKNQELRAEYIVRGQRRVAQFSWEKTVLKTVDLYERVARNDGQL